MPDNLVSVYTVFWEGKEHIWVKEELKQTDKDKGVLKSSFFDQEGK